MTTTETGQSFFGITLILCMLSLSPGFADDTAGNRQNQKGPFPMYSVKPAWVMTYYLHPAPEHFAKRVQEMSAAGLLHISKPKPKPDKYVMFLGKIMAANADQIPDWMAALSSLPEDDITTLKRAVWYSGTDEGAAWLREHKAADLADGPPPVLLADRPVLKMEPRHIDQLWEWYFATGEEEPVARIVALFSLVPQLPPENSLELLPTRPPVLEDKTQHALQLNNYRLVMPAIWSTASLAIQDDRVLGILKQSQEAHHHPRAKAWLGQVIKIAETERAKRNKNEPEQ